ncbi:MAG: DUF1566 domain-containing protein [Syntrophales bacterium]|nr:DUF1566 domain-containing protein [Syntrophales bacterium]MCK9528041.1 DUF1566 domain-containing protein [Syntrophales bacterium]MDX9922364.1 DUF1566 domain-containing protein [Syntrophales bacterium]
MSTHGIFKTVAAVILPVAVILWGCGTMPGERGDGGNGFSIVSTESDDRENGAGDGRDQEEARDYRHVSSRPETVTAPTAYEKEFSGPSATMLHTVSIEGFETGAEILIHADGPIRNFVTFLLADPDRIVCDLYGLSSPYKGEQVIAADSSPWLDRVRHYGHSRKVRVVIDGRADLLEEAVAMTVQEGLLIQIGRPVRDLRPPRQIPPEIQEVDRDLPFIAYEDGTILDTRTNLMWASRDNGNDIDWEHATSYCENYRGGGYTDWRMPKQYELAELYDGSKRYKPTQRMYTVHLTPLIELSTSWVWASETRAFDAAAFSFYNGSRHWLAQVYTSSIRALPVRSVY